MESFKGDLFMLFIFPLVERIIQKGLLNMLNIIQASNLWVDSYRNAFSKTKLQHLNCSESFVFDYSFQHVTYWNLPAYLPGETPPSSTKLASFPANVSCKRNREKAPRVLSCFYDLLFLRFVKMLFCICRSLLSTAAIDWCHNQGTRCLLPHDCWERLHHV